MTGEEKLPGETYEAPVAEDLESTEGTVATASGDADTVDLGAD
jgi:hypothetical protein